MLTPEARAYLKNLALSEVQMQANESYLKQEVVEINGKIGNKGDRVLKLVEINCVFHDPYGQVVLRERVAIAGRQMGDLRPGETKSFRFAFDSIPQSWNKQMPDLVIARDPVRIIGRYPHFRRDVLCARSRESARASHRPLRSSRSRRRGHARLQRALGGRGIPGHPL